MAVPSLPSHVAREQAAEWSVKNAMERTTQKRSAGEFIVSNFYKSRRRRAREKKRRRSLSS
jgi:hypothetical protein